MAYRIGRDTISPIAGNFAIIILASNAFYGFYFAHVRLYGLFVLLSALVIWLYLRIAILERSDRRSDYVALALACAALVATHVLGLLLYIVFALYHLLFVRRRSRWLAVPAAAIAGLVLISPHILVVIAKGLEHYIAADPGARAQSAGDVLAIWMDVTINGAPLLLVLVTAGVVLGLRQNCVTLRYSARLFVLLLLAVAPGHCRQRFSRGKLGTVLACGSADSSIVSSCRALCPLP